jgi:threonine/homoserine/homoserine lactone efflux protein
MLIYLLQGVTLGFYASVAPGPFQAYLLAQTMKQGWQRTAPAAFAPLITDGFIIALVLLVLVQIPGWLLDGLRVVGGLFLLYLAHGAYRQWRAGTPQHDAIADSVEQNVVKAVLLNFTNPNPYLFWSLVGAPILLEGWRQSVSLGLSFLAAFYSAFVVLLLGLLILFDTARRSGPAVSRALNGIAALALLLFGISQVWEGVAGHLL